MQKSYFLRNVVYGEQHFGERIEFGGMMRMDGEVASNASSFGLSKIPFVQLKLYFFHFPRTFAAGYDITKAFGAEQDEGGEDLEYTAAKLLRMTGGFLGIEIPGELEDSLGQASYFMRMFFGLYDSKNTMLSKEKLVDDPNYICVIPEENKVNEATVMDGVKSTTPVSPPPMQEMEEEEEEEDNGKKKKKKKKNKKQKKEEEPRDTRIVINTSEFGIGDEERLISALDCELHDLLRPLKNLANALTCRIFAKIEKRCLPMRTQCMILTDRRLVAVTHTTINKRPVNIEMSQTVKWWVLRSVVRGDVESQHGNCKCGSKVRYNLGLHIVPGGYISLYPTSHAQAVDVYNMFENLLTMKAPARLGIFAAHDLSHVDHLHDAVILREDERVLGGVSVKKEYEGSIPKGLLCFATCGMRPYKKSGEMVLTTHRVVFVTTSRIPLTGYRAATCQEFVLLDGLTRTTYQRQGGYIGLGLDTMKVLDENDSESTFLLKANKENTDHIQYIFSLLALCEFTYKERDSYEDTGYINWDLVLAEDESATDADAAAIANKLKAKAWSKNRAKNSVRHRF